MLKYLLVITLAICILIVLSSSKTKRNIPNVVNKLNEPKKSNKLIDLPEEFMDFSGELKSIPLTAHEIKKLEIERQETKKINAVIDDIDRRIRESEKTLIELNKSKGIWKSIINLFYH